MAKSQSNGYENKVITKTLAEYTMSLKYEGLRSEVVEVSKHCLLDWIGVCIAGVDEPLTQMLIEQAVADGGNAQASLIGDGRKVSALQAALINGSASHALDYDDVHSRLHGHPTVPVAPVVFALAEKNSACGSDLLTAFAAGVEAECRIGAYVGMTHYEKGWHNTATLGTFGAAVAAAHMLHLSSEQCALAIGIAGTSAAGLKCMFGTMCKPLHAGKAAQNGLFASEMAARGFTARTDVLERPQGFASTQCGQMNLEAAMHGLGTHFEVCDALFKYHAACYGTHAMIEAIHTLQKTHVECIDLEAVTKLEVAVQTPFLNVCAIPNPTTGLEGKFSLRFCAALAVAGKDTARLENYTDESVADPTLVAFLHKVHVTGKDTLEKMEAEVTIHLRTGTTLNARHDAGIPATDLAEQWEKLVRKFRACTEPTIGKLKAEKVIDAVRNLELAQPKDISTLLELFCSRKMAHPIVIMDGATGSQLFHLGVPRSQTMWNAIALAESQYHDTVVKVHKSYIEAGAQIVTTANYGVQPTYYRKAYPEKWKFHMEHDTVTAAKLALQARDEVPSTTRARVFGCMPPLSESHRPDLAIKLLEDEGREFVVSMYAIIADALQRGGPIDGFIIETANTFDDVLCALEVVESRGLPIIVSMEGALRSPQTLAPNPQSAAEIAKRVLDLKKKGLPLEAFGFNCAPPEILLQSLEAVKASGLQEQLNEAGVALAAYANIVKHSEAGKHDIGYDQEAVTLHLAQSGGRLCPREDMEGSLYVEFCHRFIESGATYCGGCCEVTPAQIRELTQAVRNANTAQSDHKRRKLSAVQ